MPTPSDFMERVLPWPGPEGSGWGNLHWAIIKDGKKRWRGAPYKTAQALIGRAQKLTIEPPDKDIYFCTSLQAKTGTVTMDDGRSFEVAARHADDATLIKVIFLDLDGNKPGQPERGYPTKTAAQAALFKFITDAKLPGPSAIVDSGGGYHVYWISDKPLTIAEWTPYAHGLWALVEKHGLVCDPVTTDCSRILRVPGTFNQKTKPAGVVRLIGMGCDYDFATVFAGMKVAVTAAVTKSAPFDLSAFNGYDLAKVSPELAAALAPLTDKLSDGLERPDLLLDPRRIYKECPHFRDSIARGGQGQSQGLWMQTVLASTWFENGRTFAHAMSKGYPSYTPDETDAMYDRKVADRAKGLGWPSCKAFENEGCKLCATCKYKPLGKSPLNLAERVEPPPPPAVVTNPTTKKVLTEADLRLPAGYCLWHGQICKMVNIEENEKAPPKWDYIPIFIGQVVSKPTISNHVPPTLFFKYMQGTNAIDVVIPYPAYATDQTLATAFLGLGILVDPRADKFVRHFMRSWVGKLDLAIKRLHTAPLGWIMQDGVQTGFAYGGTMFNKDGSEEDSALAGKWYNKFTPCGDEAYIHKALSVLSQSQNPALEVLCLQAWASPLVFIAGLRTTAVVWGYSGLSGKYKSTSMRTGMALWGAPDLCRSRGGATTIGLENTMDRLQHLPTQIDELVDDSAIDEVAAIFQRLGEGGQGAKATRGGGLRDDKFWQLILTCGSNKSLYDYQNKKGQLTNARAMRGFEVRVEANPVPSQYSMTDMDQLMGALEHNYGHLGLRYAKYLAMNHDVLHQRYRAMDKQVIRDLTPPNGVMPSEERFWKTTVTLTLMAAELANEVTGVKYFHPDAIRKYLYAMYAEHRGWVRRHVTTAGTSMHSEEVWNKVLRAWINDQLITDTMGGGRAGRSTVASNRIVVQPDYQRNHTTKIHWLNDPPMIRIAYTALEDTLKTMELGTAVMDEFEKMYGGKVERKVYLAGIALPEAKTRIKVWEIPITPGHPLYPMWDDKMRAFPPEGTVSAELQKQDLSNLPPVQKPEVQTSADALLAAGQAQAAKDLAKVTSGA